MDIDNILNEAEKSIGFFVRQEGNFVSLYYGTNNIANFSTNEIGEIELKKKVHIFIGLNKVIMESCEPLLAKMYDCAFSQIKEIICRGCGSYCKKPCKFILETTEKIVQIEWLYYVSQN